MAVIKAEHIYRGNAGMHLIYICHHHYSLFLIRRIFNLLVCRVSHRLSDTINSRTHLRSQWNTEAVIFSVKLYYLVTDLRRKIIALEKASRPEWRGAKHNFRTHVYSDNAMYIRTPPQKAAWCTELGQIYA